MQLTPYTFYIAKCDQESFALANIFLKIDISTGKVFSGGIQDFTTHMLPLLYKGGLLFRCNVKASTHLVAFYATNDESSFISAVPLKDYANVRIESPANANYYRVYIDGRDSYAQSIAELRGPSFLYYTHEVTPIYKTLTKRYEREKDYAFFREKLNGAITFKGEDYELIKNSKLTDKFMLLIYTGKKEQTAYSSFDSSFSSAFARTTVIKDNRAVYYKGSFGLIDCAINYSTLTAILQKTSPEDQYNKILEGLDKTYDLLKLAPRITPIYAHKRPIVQVYIGGANTVTNLIGGTYWEQDVTEPISDKTTLDQTYHFTKVKTYYELSFIREDNSLEYKPMVLDANPGIHIYTNEAAEGVVLWEKKGVDGVIWKLQIVDVTDIYGDPDGLPTSQAYHLEIGFWNEEGEPYITSDMSGEFYTDTTYSLVYFLQNWNGDYKSGGAPEFYLSNGGYAGKLISIQQNIYRRILLDKSITSITDSEGTKATYDITSDDFAIANINYRKAIGLEGGNYWVSTQTTTSPTRYGINDNGEYFTSQFIPGASGLGYKRLVPISRSGWGNASIWVDYASLYSRPDEEDISVLEAYCTRYLIKDAYHIVDILRVLLKEIDPSLQNMAVSQFFTYKATGSNPITADSFEVFLAPKSNVLKANYDQPAQKAEVTLGQILTMLTTCFNCYWDITDSQLRLEHKSFFDKGLTYSEDYDILPLNELYDQFNTQEALYGQNEKQFDTSKLYSRLEMSWPDSSTELFGPVNIDVKASYAEGAEVKTLTPDNVASDLDYMLANPNDFSQEGFALLCAQRLTNGSYEVPIIERSYKTEEDDDYKAKIQNYYASWPYMLLFHLWEGPTPNLQVSTPRKEIKQPTRLTPVERQSIVFPQGKDPNMLQAIQTDLGIGLPIKGEIDTDTRQCKIDLELLRDE